MKRRKISSWCW